MYSSLLFDFAPLAVIIYFHHMSFKNDFRKMNQYATNSQNSNSEQNLENSYLQQEEHKQPRTTESSAPQEILLLDKVLLENDDNQMLHSPHSSAVNSSLIRSLKACPAAS